MAKEAEEKEKEWGYHPKHAIFINALWTMIWATIIWRINGNYSDDYALWFLIIWISILIVPWTFLSKKFFTNTT